MRKYDVAIIGAGAAGIMAAITASNAGKRVALIERNAQLGRKLLATGNGRCNFTNKYITLDCYHGAAPKFIENIINRFDQNATIAFFEGLGLVVKEESNGRMFPRTNQASSVVELLRQRLVRNNVDMLLESSVVGIEKSVPWRVSMENGRVILSDKLILTTGGRAAHYLGSTGDGLHGAKKLGHSLTPIYAALVPMEIVEQWPKDVQGIRVEAGVWTTNGSDRLCESTGDVLFTSYGVSGPAIMAQARSIAPLLKEFRVLLHIDLFPDMTHEQLDQTVLRIFGNDGKRAIKDALVGLLPSGLIPAIIELAGLNETGRVINIKKNKRLALVKLLKDLTLTVSKLRPLKEAQVTAGGVNCDEINPQTLESKLAEGLFCAGEILDVDGDSGGFNLQWAWSSGYVAGVSCGGDY